MSNIKNQIEQMKILSQPTIAAYREASFQSPVSQEIGGFKLAEMSELDTAIHPALQDTYHMYVVIGAHSQNLEGDVTVFYANTSPENEFVKSDPNKRYVIIMDHATGKRLKVILPDTTKVEE